MKTLFSCTLLLAFLTNARAEPIQVIMVGDSITKGVRPGVKADETFSALLERGIRQQGIEAVVTNSGVGGETTVGGLKRFARDVLAKKPHLVAIMYGTNDCYVDPGKTDSRVTKKDFEANLRDMVQQLQKAGVQVVLMTEPAYAENGPKNGIGEDSNLRLGEYMAITRGVAKAPNVTLIDHFAHWLAYRAKGVKLASWTTDGYHLSPLGHEDATHRILQAILPRVQRLADEHGAWSKDSPYRIQLDVISQGYDGKKCWVHPRAGVLGKSDSVIFTMQKLLLTGSDVFDALADTRSDDLGKTWSDIRVHETSFGKRDEANGVVVNSCDFWPKWHEKTGLLLGIGQTVRYQNKKVMEKRQRETSYAIYDAQSKSWSPWKTIAMPSDAKFYACGAGSAQRVDLPNGDILLPVYFKGKEDPHYSVSVIRCTFDGKELKFLEQGNEMTIASGRGLFEPSLIQFGKKFYLTLRNDTKGYVCTSDDGLHFTKYQPWTWDDGSDLGNYNTQQHWVKGLNALYLVYTRKGAHNDHVFRHRAPLFIAQVDPEKLQVLRKTERIAVPELGARLGNFGITEVNERETWVTVAEWMQTWGPDHVIRPDNSYGGANRVFASRIRWKN